MVLPASLSVLRSERNYARVSKTFFGGGGVCVGRLGLVYKSEWQRREDLGNQRVECDRKSRIITLQSTRKTLLVLCPPRVVEKWGYLVVKGGFFWSRFTTRASPANNERIFYCREWTA